MKYAKLIHKTAALAISAIAAIGLVKPLHTYAGEEVGCDYVLEKEECYDNWGAPHRFYSYEYDDDAKLIKETIWDYCDGDTVTIYSYDERGNLTEEKSEWVNPYAKTNGNKDILYYYSTEGKIKKVETYRDGSLEAYTEYNGFGNKEKEYWQAYSGKELSLHYEWKYTETGALKQYSEYSDKEIETKRIEYNEYEKEQKIYSRNKSNKDLYLSFEYIYYSTGVLKTSISYDETGKECYRNEYNEAGNEVREYYASKIRYENEYDSTGNIVKYQMYDANGNKGGYTIYEYNDYTDVLSKTTYNSNGKVESTIKYEYDSNGNKIKGIRYNEKGEVKESKEWDNYGNVIKTVFYSEGTQNNVHISETEYHYVYDDNGNIREESEYYEGELCHYKKYKYVGKKNENQSVESEDLTEKVDTENTYKEYGLSDKYVPSGYEDNSGSEMIIEGKNLSWYEANGKFYWYENGIKQGTYYDPNGVLGTDPDTGVVSNRGREICDNNKLDEFGNGTWFWLDACYDGAKAVGKEVWVPYIYQQENEWSDEELRAIANESDAGMADLVYNFMKEKKGKWVRYDENGGMLKGWVTIEGTLAEKYPDQAGNTYYYDSRTGLMAKGKITIDGVEHFFEENSGVMQY